LELLADREWASAPAWARAVAHPRSEDPRRHHLVCSLILDAVDVADWHFRLGSRVLEMNPPGQLLTESQFGAGSCAEAEDAAQHWVPPQHGGRQQSQVVPGFGTIGIEIPGQAPL
jgi:hypothetical protein